MLPGLYHGLAVITCVGVDRDASRLQLLDRARDQLPNCLSGLRMHLNTIPEEDNRTSLVEGRECRRPLSKSTMSLLFRLFVLVPIYR